MKTLRTRFRAPWDLLLILITTGVLVLLIGLAYAIGSPAVIVFNWGLILLCAAFGVYGYSIQDSSLKILRLGWSKDIRLTNIKQVEVKQMAMMGSIRLFGIGGFFGYIGNFKNSILNHYKAYVTHRKKTVLIVTDDDRQILISPDDPEEFVRSLRSAMDQESSG